MSVPIRFAPFVLLLVCGLYGCQGPPPKKEEVKNDSDPSPWPNHSDSARYVGINACRQCHQDIYETFVRTGMGRSLHLATRQKSAADFLKPEVYDKIADLHYKALWNKDSLYFSEYRLAGKDTIHARIEQVNYIIGSGQHTNSHLQNNNGYVTQMPMTFYTQKKKWDLPPGFENGVNTRFNRKIGLECMSCHNALPEFVLGSENKYRSVPLGINCERCHGPGSIHVAERRSSAPVDTSKYIDYSIVNPGKLSADLQFDICQRCHLQGNAVLKEGRSFFDFKPGQKLSDHISVFLPKYSDSEEDFIMASHADRLKQSPCFIKSLGRTAKDPLRPAKGGMTCVTCHNPHVSVKETNPNVFNDACMNCHNSIGQSEKQMLTFHKTSSFSKISDCVSCHMPLSGAIDIPHVSVHDHYIRKPVSKKEKEKIRQFLGLVAVNESNPSHLTLALAYLNQYEKFSQELYLLDSADFHLQKVNETEKKIHAQVQLMFAKQDLQAITKLIKKNTHQKVLTWLNKSSYDNGDAWTCYRVSEAFYATGDLKTALLFSSRACQLAPYNLEFRNKKALVLAGNNQMKEAEKEFDFILTENPKFAPVYANIGYLRLLAGQHAEALRLYNTGLKLEPDNEALLLNLAGYYLYMKNTAEARKYVQRVLSKDPAHAKALMVLKQMNSL